MDGKVLQVMGPVVDVEFPPGELPEIYTAVTLQNPAIGDLGFLCDAIAGNPGTVCDEGTAASGIAIEERRLADVGTTDDRDNRKLGIRRHGIETGVPFPARENAAYRARPDGQHATHAQASAGAVA